jgi:AcrR family transcriptional regulator
MRKNSHHPIRGRTRIERRQVDKFAERRKQLAAAALETLSKLGYANTSLREIAQNSEFTHGVVHYYFADKAELITYCVKQYKEECVTRYDQIVAAAESAGELKSGFAMALAQTLLEDAAMHRLWYDLRNQSLFDSAFRAEVLEIDRSLERMIWRIVSKYAELARAPVRVAPEVAYALFDGLFQQALLKFVTGSENAARDLRAHSERVLESLLDRGPGDP